MGGPLHALAIGLAQMLATPAAPALSGVYTPARGAKGLTLELTADDHFSLIRPGAAPLEGVAERPEPAERIGPTDATTVRLRLRPEAAAEPWPAYTLVLAEDGATATLSGGALAFPYPLLRTPLPPPAAR